MRFLFDYISPYAYIAWTQVPAKRVYVFKHTVRTARRLGIPLAAPPSHPFNPLLALRCSSLPMPDDTRRAFIDALFAATWGGGPGVEQPEIVARLATEVGLDGPDIVAQAQSPAAKERLRSQTDEALRAGVFGVPTILIGDELFWGYDSFPDVEQHLRGEDPVSATALARWADIPATARR